MKIKKILSIFFLVVVITTFFVPMFSIITYAAHDSGPTYDYIEFTLGSTLQNGTIIEIRGVDGSIVFDHNDVANTSKKFYFLGIQPFVVTEQEEYYDVGEEYYEIVYTGPDYHYPYLDFYDLAGNRIHGMYLDQDSSEHVYISPDESVTITLNYSEESYSEVTYIRRFTLDDLPSIEESYSQGYYEGWQAARGYYLPQINDSFQDGHKQGYEVGIQDGIIIGENSSFGNNLIGDTLSAPVKALDSLVLYETSAGFKITLWGIFSTVLAVGLVIWFIKMFAGG